MMPKSHPCGSLIRVHAFYDAYLPYIPSDLATQAYLRSRQVARGRVVARFIAPESSPRSAGAIHGAPTGWRLAGKSVPKMRSPV